MKIVSKSNYFAIVLFAFLIASCVSLNEEGTAQVISIDDKSFESPSSIHTKGVIKDIELVSLSQDSIFFGNIDNIIINDTLIYLLDKNQKQCVYIYTITGRYLRTISRQGRGNTEYVRLSDIFVDKKNKTLNLLSRIDKRLLIYDVEGKKLMQAISLPKMFTAIQPIENGYLAYMGNYSEDKKSPYNFWLLDNNFIIKSHFGKINPTIESRENNDVYVFSSYNSKINIISEMNYDVYEIESPKETHQIKYQYDFGKRNLPKNITTDMLDNPEDNFKLHNNYVCNLYRFQQINNYCLAIILFQGQKRMIVWDKNTLQGDVATLDTYQDKYLCGFGNIKGMDEKYIIAMEDARTLYDIWLGHNEHNNFEIKYRKQVDNLRKQFPVIKPNDNPYLILYKLK